MGNARDISLISILAALYYVISIFPGIPIIGGKGRIDIATSITPIFGILLGPWKGSLTSLIGVLLAWILPPGSPTIYSLIFLPAPILSSFVSGFLSGNSIKKIPGQVPASLVTGGLISLWYLTWVGQKIPFYPIPHLIALLVIIFLGKYISNSIKNYKLIKKFKRNISISIFLISYCGLMTDHMYGDIAFIIFANLFMPLSSIPFLPSLFMAVLPISIIERITMTTIALIIGLPLLKVFKNFY